MKLLVFFAVLLLGVGASARPPSEVEQLDRQGREAFQAGDHTKAAQAFGALLARLPSKDPLRLQTMYNHARALQEAQQPCPAVTAFEGYLQDRRANARKEAKRKAKAQSGLEQARLDCKTQRARAAQPKEEPLELTVPEVPVVAEVVEPLPPEDPDGLLVMVGLVSGAVFGEQTARARTTLGVGAGWQMQRWVGDVEARLSIEDPTAGADAAVMLRPGLRWNRFDSVYLRGALPVLVSPITALGLHGGGGLRLPLGETFALTGEAGGTLWLADPSLVALEARLGMEAGF